MENTVSNTLKNYKQQGKARAADFLSRRRAAKGAQRREIISEQRQKIHDWKKNLSALEKKERKAQKKAYKAYKRRLHRTRSIIAWVVVICVLITIGHMAQPLVHNIGAIMSLSYTDQTAQAQAAREAGLSFAPQISDEGIVLLKNENNLLPLENKKVNIFGDDAYNFKYSGGGSGAVDLTNCVTLFQGLEMAGIEYNPQLHKLYEDMGNNARDTGSNNIVSMMFSFLFGAKTKDTGSNDFLTSEVLEPKATPIRPLSF